MVSSHDGEWQDRFERNRERAGRVTFLDDVRKAVQHQQRTSHKNMENMKLILVFHEDYINDSKYLKIIINILHDSKRIIIITHLLSKGFDILNETKSYSTIRHNKTFNEALKIVSINTYQYLQACVGLL